MKKHQAVRSVVVYVGFSNGRPHVPREGGRAIAVYVSKAAASRVYEDVRTARMVFDADWRRG